jgi:hypothetical protein
MGRQVEVPQLAYFVEKFFFALLGNFVNCSCVCESHLNAFREAVCWLNVEIKYDLGTHPRRKYLKRPVRLGFFQGDPKKSFSTE